MRLFSPMTLIVVVALALCLIAGLVIILRTTRRGDRRSRESCPQCGAVNRTNAKFCSRCGTDVGARS